MCPRRLCRIDWLFKDVNRMQNVAVRDPGKCGTCQKPSAPGHKQCQRCLDRQKGYYQSRKAANAARGKCIICGKEPPKKGRKYCLYCLGKASEANAMAYPKRAKKAREYARQKRQEHKASGLCHCGRAPKPGCKSCPSCLKRRIRMINQKRLQRFRNGMCHTCGKEPILPGLKIGACCQRINPHPKVRRNVPMSRNHPWYRLYVAAMKKARWKAAHTPADSQKGVVSQCPGLKAHAIAPAFR